MVRDTAPFFEGGVAKRLYLGRSVPVQLTRVVVEAPAGADLRHAVRMLPGASVMKEQKDGKVRLTIEVGPLDGMQGEEPLLPNDLPRWPHVDFTTTKSWAAVADAYRKMVEPQVRVDTGEEDAAVAIFPAHLLSRLPEVLRTEDEEEKAEEKQAQPKRTPRNDDWVLPKAFVNEWHYRIVPPVGFEAQGLPENSGRGMIKGLALGPAPFL